MTGPLIQLGTAIEQGVRYQYALAPTEGASRYLPEGWTVYRRRAGERWGAVSSFSLRTQQDALRYAARLLLGMQGFRVAADAPEPFNRVKQARLFKPGTTAGEQTTLF